MVPLNDPRYVFCICPGCGWTGPKRPLEDDDEFASHSFCDECGYEVTGAPYRLPTPSELLSGAVGGGWSHVNLGVLVPALVRMLGQDKLARAADHTHGVDGQLAAGRTRLVYVAGPYRAATHWGVEENIMRAREVAARVWAMGFAAICPHMNTAHMSGVAEEETFLAGTMEMLRRCDAVVLVQGWEKSSGSQAEVAEANRLGIPVFGETSRTQDDALYFLKHLPEPVYAAIEDCSTDITEERAREIIADLAAAWATYQLTMEKAVAREVEHDDDDDDDDECPSDATAEAPAAETSGRLDYSEPPPGYDVDDHSDEEFHWSAPGGLYDLTSDEHCGAGTMAKCLAAAWAHHKARNDPPRFRVSLWESWSPPAGEFFAWECDIAGLVIKSERFDAVAEARAAAWVWYDRRLALALRFDLGDEGGARVNPALQDVVEAQGWSTWPRILTWTDEQVATVEHWLVDSTAEMPEVLRG